MSSGAGVTEASELEEDEVVDGVCMAELSFALEVEREGVDVFCCRRVDLLGVEGSIVMSVA